MSLGILALLPRQFTCEPLCTVRWVSEVLKHPNQLHCQGFVVTFLIYRTVEPCHPCLYSIDGILLILFLNIQWFHLPLLSCLDVKYRHHKSHLWMCWQINQHSQGWEYSSTIQCLSCMYKALTLIPSNTHACMHTNTPHANGVFLNLRN